MRQENLINKRKELNMTQAEVASKANVNVRAYQDYEYGRRAPGIGTAISIADALKVKDLRLLWGGNPAAK